MRYVIITLSLLIIFGCSPKESEENPVIPVSYNILGEVDIVNTAKWEAEDNIYFRMYKYGITEKPDVEAKLYKPINSNHVVFTVSDLEKARYQAAHIIYLKKGKEDKPKILADYGEVIISKQENVLPQKTINLDVDFSTKYSMIQSDLFDPYCVSCHNTNNPLGSLDLTQGISYNQLVNRKSVIDSKYLLVKPFEADSSYLIYTLFGTHNSPLMPPKPLKVFTNSQIEIIKEWINEGAKKE